LLVALTACHAAPRPPVPAPAGWREEMAARWSRVATLRGEARVTLNSPEGPYPGRMTLLLSRPGRLRLDFFSPFGTPEGTVILAGGAARGSLSAEGQARLAGLLRLLARDAEGVAAADVLGGLLAGMLPWPGGATPEGVTVEAAADGGRSVTVSVKLDRPGEAALRVAYPAYAPGGDVPLPARVELSEGEGERPVLELTWVSLEVNPALEEGLFGAPGTDGGP
jgi:hypothetical protein